MDAKSKKTFPTINPATGKKITDVAEADKVLKLYCFYWLFANQHVVFKCVGGCRDSREGS